MNLKSYKDDSNSVLLTTTQLMDVLQCGRVYAKKIGNEAGARVQFGNSVRWNRKKIVAYVDSITEDDSKGKSKS